MRSFPIPLIGLAALAVACSRPSPKPGVAQVADAPLPAGPLNDAVQRGRALVLATRDSLPRNVGNKLRCVSCHLDGGRREVGSWVGVYGRYPTYRPRSAMVETIEFRVNDCFKRSMNGAALAVDGPDMRDIVAYLWYLSRGVPVHEPAAGPPAARRFLALTPDTAAGARTFAATCAKCHAPGGQGTAVAPPLWGPGSYNIGAGMSRLSAAANFIRANMPFDQPGTLSDQQALDVAAYVNAHPRPDYAPKQFDWPNGDAPPDAA
ncbi:MAG TPA: c-type cytochrome, partial [Gemmatimonadales bacterium]